MNILICIAAALNAGLRLRIAIQTSEYELHFVLHFIEFGVCLIFVSFSECRADLGYPHLSLIH
jgi:hypothetical protein